MWWFKQHCEAQLSLELLRKLHYQLNCIPQTQHLKCKRHDLFPQTLLFVKAGKPEAQLPSCLNIFSSVTTAFCWLLITLQIGTDNTMLIWQAGGLASCFPASKTRKPLWIGQQDTVEHKAGLGPPCVPVYQGLSFIDSSIVALIKIFHASENSTAAKVSLIRVL